MCTNHVKWTTKHGWTIPELTGARFEQAIELNGDGPGEIIPMSGRYTFFNMTIRKPIRNMGKTKGKS